jgi:hypothetical protein
MLTSTVLRLDSAGFVARFSLEHKVMKDVGAAAPGVLSVVSPTRFVFALAVAGGAAAGASQRWSLADVD